ncbi:MAG TPA: sulfatase-like hydrolase/transferase, partial [Chthoniobacteraceae bacterium]|nr:sulfatase-like hydrolase/transferase [Chthoniobacteraceae bacterium]
LCLAAHAALADRPNFLFVYTDDQRWDAMSVVQHEQGDRGRFPWLQTPNMDRLATEGVRFRNAFVTLSLCAPSRAAFLTGRYNHLNGIANNRTAFHAENVTHATLLRAAGYVTGYVGKWHMGNQRGQRPGFDFSASFIGQGKYFDCPIELNGVETPSKGWVDDVSTDYAIEFIRKNKAQPWSLVVGYKTAHGPFTPPERAKDRFAGAEARPVPNLDVPAIYLADSAVAKPKKAAGTATKRPTNLGYFRCISAADDNLGRLLATLDELGLAENTVVVFASDNGFYLGEHGLGDKRTGYDESLRIPLLVRYPKLGASAAGRTVDAIALNIDLAPTFLDFAGVARPEAIQGRSWRPLLEGKPGDWRTSFLFEYFREGQFAAPTVFGVRTATAKLIRYPGHDEWTELFDLQADPYELKNLVADAASRELRTQLETELETQSKTVGFVVPNYADEKSGPAAAPTSGRRASGMVLSFDFAKDDGVRIVDLSGNKNHGAAQNVPIITDSDGRKARQFDGKGYVEVPNSASLNPAGGAWSVEAVVKSDKPDGIIVARGGRTQGYALHLADGHAVFTVTVNNTSTSVTTEQTITGAWTHLTGVLDADGQLFLYIDGELSGTAKSNGLIARDPHDLMQIGADLGSPVLGDRKVANFNGLIASVRLFSGERLAKDIAADAARK